MRRLLALLALAFSAALLAAPAAHAGWFPSEAIDGPSPDIVGFEDVDVARDGDGGVVYLKREAGVPHVFLSRLVDGAWRAPERVDAGLDAAATEAAVAVADGQRIAITFVSGGRLYGSVVTGDPAVAPLPAPGLLHADPAVAIRDVHMDMGINGTAYAVYTGPGGGGADVRAVRLQDQTWQFVAAPLDVDPARAAGEGAARARVAVSAEGNAVATWGEGGAVFGRRITGLALSLAPQQVSLAELGGVPAGSADSPDIDIEDDGSFAWVVFRQDVGGVSRALGRRLVGSQFEAPEAVDGGRAGWAPRVEMSGRGAGVGVADGGGSVLGSLLERDTFSGGGRLDQLGGVEPVVAASERISSAVAWLGGDVLHARFKTAGLGEAFEPAQGISRPELGGVVRGQYELAGSRLGDVAAAMAQGPEGARAITVAHYDRPPGISAGRNSSNYARGSRPLLRWRAGLDLWGPQTFRVFVDGAEVGQTLASSFRVPAPLADGAHRWYLIGVDRRGQAVQSRTRTVRIDGVAPTARVRVTGARRVGQFLRVSVTARDARRGSGLDRVLLSAGDGSRTVRIAKTHLVRYRRAGSYTLVVRALDEAGNERRVEQRLRIRR